jgi:hypothetical protein
VRRAASGRPKAAAAVAPEVAEPHELEHFTRRAVRWLVDDAAHLQAVRDVLATDMCGNSA